MQHAVFMFPICLSCVLFIGCSSETEPTPKEKPEASFRIVPPSHDFGRVRESEGSVSLEFVIENLGAKPLNISDVISGCGCTVVDLPTKNTFVIPVYGNTVE